MIAIEEKEDNDWVCRQDGGDAAMDAWHEYEEEETDGEVVDAERWLSEDVSASNNEETPLHGSCTICLQALQQPVMIRKCFHVFCFPCLRTWADKLSLHGVKRPTCPLCKVAFDAVYADVISETEYRVIVFDGGPSTASSTATARRNAAERKRAVIYQCHLRLARINDEPVSEVPPRRVKQRGQYEDWVKRELRVCVGCEVDLTVLLALIACCLEPQTARALTDSTTWMAALTNMLEPFLLQDTELFVRELAFFLGSRLNTQGYDSAVAYCCPDDAGRCAVSDCSVHHAARHYEHASQTVRR